MYTVGKAENLHKMSVGGQNFLTATVDFKKFSGKKSILCQISAFQRFYLHNDYTHSPFYIQNDYTNSLLYTNSQRESGKITQNEVF